MMVDLKGKPLNVMILSGSFFVIPEHLASIRTVVLAFTSNKQTNNLNYVYMYI